MTRFHYIAALFLMTACVTNKFPESKFGISPSRTGFVPARIALTKCMPWPDGSTKLKNMPISNRPAEELAKLCEDLDKYIADGFDNQPFMKGVSHKYIEKLYKASGLTPEISQVLTSEWRGLSTDCQNCINLPTFYNTSIKSRSPWLIWLSKFSTATNGSDAILIPFLLSENTRVEDNRGILHSIRSGAIAVLLIDTNDGSLIWSGGRESEIIFKSLTETATRSNLKPPPIEDLKMRLLTDAIWLEFPGRQIFR